MELGEALGDNIQILLAVDEKFQLGELMELPEQPHCAGRYPIRITSFCYPSVELSAVRHVHCIKLTRSDGHWAY